jgi:hypothetical protein
VLESGQAVGAFLKDRVTFVGSDYFRQIQISRNTKAEKPN